MSRTKAALLLAFLLGVPTAAWGHASLVKSVPARRAVLDRSPTHVDLWFNERLEARYSTVTLVGPGGAPVPLESVEVSREQPRRLRATVGPLAPGRYVVRYRVLSADGHVVQGEFAFTVRQ